MEEINFLAEQCEGLVQISRVPNICDNHELLSSIIVFMSNTPLLFAYTYYTFPER